MQTEIEEFIKRRFKSNCNWLDGNCYYFAVILKERFPVLEINYDYLNGHFIVSDPDGKFYDFTGCIVPDSHIKLETIKRDDPAWYERLRRDCIL